MSANGSYGGFWGAFKRRMFGASEANLRESLEDVLEEAKAGAMIFPMKNAIC